MTKSVYTARYAELRRLLVDARRSAGLTQADVADRLGKPQSYLSKLESGERRIDLVELLELVEAVDGDAVAILKRVQRVRA